MKANWRKDKGKVNKGAIILITTTTKRTNY